MQNNYSQFIIPAALVSGFVHFMRVHFTRGLISRVLLKENYLNSTLYLLKHGNISQILSCALLFLPSLLLYRGTTLLALCW